MDLIVVTQRNFATVSGVNCAANPWLVTGSIVGLLCGSRASPSHEIIPGGICFVTRATSGTTIRTAWRRQADGTYIEEMYRGGIGIVPVHSLPGVAIDLEALLDS